MGPADTHLRRIEGAFDEAMVVVRGNQVLIVGPAEQVEQVTSVFSQLIKAVEGGEIPTSDEVDILLGQVTHGVRHDHGRTGDVILSHHGRPVRPKTAGQRRYVEAIRSNSITFGVGPAGTGKTYLAMAMAVAALKRHEVSRIVLTRPVVEAGESLGFLWHARGEARPLCAAALRRASRHGRCREGRHLHGAGHHRDRAARLHARTHVQ